MLTTFYSGIIQNAPFRSQIFQIFFASGGKGALTHPDQNPADVPVTIVSRSYDKLNIIVSFVMRQ